MDESDSENSSEHPLATEGISRIWRPSATKEIELLYGRYRSFAFTRHFHPVAAIGVVESGVMQTYWEGKEYHLPAGTVILFNAGEVHAPQAATDQGWAFRMFYFDCPQSDAFKPPFIHPFVEDQGLASLLLRAHRSFQNGETAIRSESFFVSSLEYARRYSDSKRTSLALVRGTKIKQALEYLRENCIQNITLKELANVVDISPYHLIRSFHREVGIPPHTYLMQTRVEYGQKLLRSGLSIAEAALHAGFVDQSHFTRHFKRFVGATPGQYCF